MKRPELLAETTTPDGMRMTLSLHTGNYYIDVDGQGLMSTRAPGSERAMAEMAAEELKGCDRPRVLIGGLGLGFTLAAALDTFPAASTIVVVEYFETIVDWNRKFGFQSSTDLLADSRVMVAVTDVVDYLREVQQPFDAILLDVDNGPDAWTLASNDRLYNRPGLQQIQRALTPGGVLAVWSAEASPVFESRLAAVGFDARSEPARSNGKKGERHTIFLGLRGRPDG
ncbi:MAG: MnmC family methyltransferase [Acidobacteriota bacterium]|nr:MnmC family methyltransferase [Acidobacteriota bacterium]MDH3784585.1 MnmC family methyltransferase [Acidobacteriota bacterium]